MRISGGKFGGLLLKAPKSVEVRPTQDRVREALFSMLMEAVPGARFLDLYAGTGAVGLEALSRGAADVTWVEGSPAVARVLSGNVRRIAGGDFAGNVVVSDVARWLKAAGANARFDIVFADPPYADARDDGLAGLASRLADGGVVGPGGVFVAEVPVEAAVAAADGWKTLRDRVYGKTRLVVRQLG